MSADNEDSQPTFTREELRVLKQIASLTDEEREQLQNVLNPNRTTRRALLKGATGLGALSLLGVGATETGAAASGTYGNGNQNWNVNKVTAAQSDLGKLVGDINGNGHAITGLSSVDTDDVNSVHYASNLSTDSHPDFQTAVNNASAGDKVVLIAGDHPISSEQTVDKTLKLEFQGQLVKSGSGGFTGLNITENAPWCILSGWAIVKGPGSGTEAAGNHGVEINRQFMTAGTVASFDNGGHGFYINSDTTAANLNTTRASLYPGWNGGDGVRIENSGGNENVNGMRIHVTDAIGNGGAGVSQYGGFNNIVTVGASESNGTGLRLGTASGTNSVARGNAYLVGDIEGSSSSPMDLSGSQNNAVKVLSGVSIPYGSVGHQNTVETAHGTQAAQQYGWETPNIPGDGTVTNIANTNWNRQALLIVTGTDSATFNAFTDLVLVAGQNTYSVINQETRGTITRTYSRSSNDFQIAISTATSGSYTVKVASIGA